MKASRRTSIAWVRGDSRAPTVWRGSLVVALLLILTACVSTSAGGNPDPGNRLLHLMETDPVITDVPPSATGTQTTATPAAYTTPAFQPPGWNGPAVVVTFTSTAPTLDIYAHYARTAAENGWIVKDSGHLHVPDTWTKTLSGYRQIFLSVVDLGSGKFQISVSGW